LRLVSIFFE